MSKKWTAKNIAVKGKWIADTKISREIYANDIMGEREGEILVPNPNSFEALTAELINDTIKSFMKQGMAPSQIVVSPKQFRGLADSLGIPLDAKDLTFDGIPVNVSPYAKEGSVYLTTDKEEDE